MKNPTIVILSSLCLLFSIFLSGTLKAQTASVTINYTGFQACGGCTVCGQDYWCFNTLSSWCGNTAACGTQSFTDPVPPGNIITNISINYFSGQCNGGSLTATINGSTFPTVNEGSLGCPCSSNPCGVAASTGSTFPCGIPSYNYGASNNFQLCTGADVCVNNAVLTMTYVPANQASPATQPGAISGTSPVCVAVAQNYSIPAVANASSYTWTVPAGWTINSGQGTTGINATPGSSGNICVTASNLCGTSASTCFNVTVGPPITPTFTQVNPICSGSPLGALPTTSNNGITGTWSPAMNNTSTTLYTFTPTAGLCANTTTMTITVNPNVTPTFTPVAAICNGDPLGALPTTSNNGITGTWSPAINNTSTTLYTFTPTAGACATTATMTITVTPNTTPTFTQVNPICDGDPLAALPTTSNNGVTGTWSPAVDNTITTLYTFTPSAGLCSPTTTMTITVTPNTTPTFTQVNPICDGDPLAALPTTSNNGVTGTWSPAINNTSTTLYTFTPTAGVCATTATMTITVTPNTTPTFTPVAAICDGDPLAALPTTSTNGVTGTWSPAINNTSTTLYTFTPTAGLCATTTTMTITVNPIVAPTFTQVNAICDGGALAALPTTSTNGVTGTWSPAINNTSTTLYTFTPIAGACATTTTMTITVNPNDDPNFAYASGTYCLTGTDPLPSVITTPGGTFTITAPGSINPTTGLIDLGTSGLGAFTVTYNTPGANPCPSSTTFLITITAAPSAGFNYGQAAFCQDSIDPVLTMNAGAVSGVFSATPGGLTIDAAGNIILASSTPGIYTIYNNVASAGGCAAAVDSTTFEVLQVDSALFNYGSSSYCVSGLDPIAAITGTAGGIFTISAPGAINSGDGTIDLSTSGLGTFTIYYNTAPAGNACPALDSIQITIDSVNTITPNPIVPICATDPLTLTATGSGVGVITWYSDAGGTTSIGTGSPLLLSNPGVGIFTYYVNNVGSCSSTMDSVVVVVGGVSAVINAAPVTGAIPLSVFFGNGSTTGAGITYTWDFGDGNTSNQFEPTNVYNGAGTYTAILIVTDGICSDTTSIIIDAFGESAILIPNVFSPNGDGSNDVFTVDGINLESVEGEIFNRWGQKMFSWGNVKGYWDGRTLAGSEAPEGTYFYIIKAKGFDGSEYFEKGGVSLIR